MQSRKVMAGDNTNLKTRSLYEFIKTDSHFSWVAILSAFQKMLDRESSTIIDTMDNLLITPDLISYKGAESKLELSFDLEKDSDDTDNSFFKENYMSPDHLLNAELDERSHVYSLGCILYECISKRPVFDATKAKVLAENQIAFTPNLLRSHNQDLKLPESVRELVHKCIEKDPEGRFQSLEELSKSIEDALESYEQNKDNAPEKKEEVNRKPLLVSGSIMLLLTFIIVGTIQFTSSDGFRSYIVNSNARSKDQYFLSVENAHYRLQMDFEGGKLKPLGNKVPLMLRQRKSNKILFATTRKKTVKEAVEEAVKRDLYLPNIDLREADLKGLKLKKAYLAQADFSGADLSGAEISNSRITGSKFVQSNLSNTTFNTCIMEFVDLRGALMKEATLKGCFLPEAKFQKASLVDATLDESDLASCNVQGADFTNATFNNTNTGNIDWSASNLTAEQYKQTRRGKQGITLEQAIKEVKSRKE